MAEQQPENRRQSETEQRETSYAADPLIGPLFENAEVIFAYTRADALADGVLVDVSDLARETGFSIPVALTAALWADIQAIPSTPECAGQDATGRLWDVLQVAWHNIRVHGNEAGDTLVYQLILPVTGGDERPGTLYTVKCVIGPDDAGVPCLTFLRPDED